MCNNLLTEHPWASFVTSTLHAEAQFWTAKKNKEIRKNALYLSVNVFSTKVLIGDTILTSPTGDGTAILCGHASHAKVQPLAAQREYLHFSVILRP